MFVDRVFTSYSHLELYCMTCGKRDMYNNPERFGPEIRWIILSEKMRAKTNGNQL
jgi:hypothetical protein